MIIKRIGVQSLAKMAGAIYTLLGFVFGVFVAIFSVLGIGMAGMGGHGVAAVVIFPVIYGVMGFVGGALTAYFYNFFAAKIGGISFETDRE